MDVGVVLSTATIRYTLPFLWTCDQRALSCDLNRFALGCAAGRTQEVGEMEEVVKGSFAGFLCIRSIGFAVHAAPLRRLGCRQATGNTVDARPWTKGV